MKLVGITIDDRDEVRGFARKREVNYLLKVGQLAAIELAKAAGNKLGR